MFIEESTSSFLTLSPKFYILLHSGVSRVVFVCDETMYSSSLKFADGTNLNANCEVSENVKDLFYALAEKYGEEEDS